MGSESEYLLLEELSIGDVIIGSHMNPNWDTEYTVTGFSGNNLRVVNVWDNRRGRDDSLIGGNSYRFRVKQPEFLQYDPKQAGDTDDDI